MAYTPKKVSVTMPSFEFGTAKYMQGLQTAKDDRATKKRTEARLDLQDQRQLRQDELRRMRLQQRDKAQDAQWEHQNKVTDANIARAIAQDKQVNKATELKNTLDAEVRERAKQTKAAAWDVNKGNTFTIDDYKKQAPNLLIPLEGLETEQRNAVAYLQDAGDTVNSLDTAMNSYKHNIGDDYSPADVTAKAQQRRLELEEYRKMVSAAATPKEKAALVKKFVTTMYTPRLNVMYGNIAKGRGLPISTRQQILDSRVIPEDVRKYLLPSDVANLHKRALVGAVSRDALYSKETARLKEEYDKQTQQIKWYNEFLKRNQDTLKTYSGSKKGSFASKTKNAQQAMADIAGLDIGYFDNQDAKNGYLALTEKYNISPEIAAMVINFNIDNGLIGKSAYSVTDNGFIDIVDQAKALQKSLSSKSNSKGGKSYNISENKFRHHASKRRSVDNLLAERFGAGSANSAVIPLTPASRARIKDIVAKKPALSGSTSPLWKGVKDPLPPEKGNIKPPSISKNVLQTAPPFSGALNTIDPKQLQWLQKALKEKKAQEALRQIQLSKVRKNQKAVNSRPLDQHFIPQTQGPLIDFRSGLY